MVIERLTAHHGRDVFDCGEESLNRYLRESARQKTDRDLGVTFVLVPGGASSEVLGYYTLVAGTASGETVPERTVAGQRVVPVIKLARLAVDKRRQGQGLGELLLVHALYQVQLVAERVGAYAVTVDALSDRARRFYLHYGVKPLLDDPQHLYVTLSSLRAMGLTPATG